MPSIQITSDINLAWERPISHSAIPLNPKFVIGVDYA